MAGCHSDTQGQAALPPPTPSADNSASSHSPSLGPMATFTDTSANIKFQYPSSWKQIKGATAVLTVVAPAPAAGGGQAALFLDVPKVPIFAAAMLSAEAVTNGYINDVKKNRISDAQVQNKEMNVGGESAKDVTISGKETGSAPGLPPEGSDATEEAVCLVRSGKIYIFSCDSDTKGTAIAHAALMAAVQSVQWTH